MSYRHSSYRKTSRAVAKARQPDGRHATSGLTRAEKNRVMHWSGLPPLRKPPGWGKPRKARS